MYKNMYWLFILIKFEGLGHYIYRKDFLKTSISLLDVWFYLDGADHNGMLIYVSTLLCKVTVNWLHMYP